MFYKLKKYKKKTRPQTRESIDVHSKIDEKIDTLNGNKQGKKESSNRKVGSYMKNVKRKAGNVFGGIGKSKRKKNIPVPQTLEKKKIEKPIENPEPKSNKPINITEVKGVQTKTATIEKKKKERAGKGPADIEWIDEILYIDEHGRQVMEEKTGFGWKGQGTRRIVFDEKLGEYLYEVIEPQLNKNEEDIKNKLIYLFRIRADIDVFAVDTDERMKQLEKALQQIINENQIRLNEEAKDRIFYHIFHEFAGYGKIDIMMHDEGIEDISCDGHDIPIFIFHKIYESIKANVIYNSAEELDSFVVKLSQMCGKQISVYEPVVDGKLADGSRLQTTLGRTITRRSTFTIRRFREDPLTPVDLIANNTLSADMAAYFWIAIEKGSSILFCGGTATGKTTMLNALSLFVPSAYKIVSVEDTREINLPHENWIAGTTRTGFSSSETSKTGKDIDMFDLIRVALRQRPRVIIVGEVRGKEAYTLFQAMTTGHLSYSTVHASDMHGLIQRLESPPISLPRALLTSLDLIVFLNSVTVGGIPVRRTTNVTEIIKLDPETNRLVTLTPFQWVSEIEDRFENNAMELSYRMDGTMRDLIKSWTIE